MGQKNGRSGRAGIGKEGLGKGSMTGLELESGYDRVTMIDADKGQGKNSRWLHLPKTG